MQKKSKLTRPEMEDEFSEKNAITPCGIKDEDMDEMVRLWSKVYGRTISRDEAVEIFLNVKHLCEVLGPTLDSNDRNTSNA